MEPSITGPIVRLPADGRTVDLGGFTVRVLADVDETTGTLALIETTERTTGLGPPIHIHHDTAESFVVLAGSYVMWLDGDEVECPVGAFVYVPRGLRHTFWSAADESRKLNLYTPAGMVGYFDELAAAIAAGVDAAGLDAIATRYHMEVVGPIPEGYL